MNSEELRKIFIILKKNKIPKGEVAEALAITPGYISKMISGKKPITKQFTDGLFERYAGILPKNLYMQNKIFLKNIRRARILLGYSITEYADKFKFDGQSHVYAVERGEVEIPVHVMSNIYDDLCIHGFIKDGVPDLDTQYLDEADSIELLNKENETVKKAGDVVTLGHRDELKETQAAEDEPPYNKPD